MVATRLAVVLSLTLATPAAVAWCRTTEPRTPEDGCNDAMPIAWPITCVGVTLNTHALDAATAAGQSLGESMRRWTPWAAARWSEVSCAGGPTSLRVVMMGEDDVAAGLAFDGRNVVSVNRRWTPDVFHRPGTIAITLVTNDVLTGALLDADIELNARDVGNPLGRPFGDGAPTWGVADGPTVLLHEFGHLVGLDHSRVLTAVMAAGRGDVERQRRALVDDDRDGLCDAYPVTGSRPAPSPGCVPQRAVAPRIAVLGGGGCIAVPASRTRRAYRVWMLVVVCALRRDPRSATTLRRISQVASGR